MDKEKYECTELEIFKFQTEDVITTSGTVVDGNTSIVLPEDIF